MEHCARLSKQEKMSHVMPKYQPILQELCGVGRLTDGSQSKKLEGLEDTERESFGAGK